MTDSGKYCCSDWDIQCVVQIWQCSKAMKCFSNSINNIWKMCAIKKPANEKFYHKTVQELYTKQMFAFELL
jgi:hypothetical protein